MTELNWEPSQRAVLGGATMAEGWRALWLGDAVSMASWLQCCLALPQCGCLTHMPGVREVRTFCWSSGSYSDLLLPGHSIFFHGKTRQLGKTQLLWVGYRRELPHASGEMGVPALCLERMLSGDRGKGADSSVPNDTNRQHL